MMIFIINHGVRNMMFIALITLGVVLAVQREGVPMFFSGLTFTLLYVALPLLAGTAPTEMGKVVLPQILLAGLTLMYVGGIVWQLNRGWKV